MKKSVIWVVLLIAVIVFSAYMYLPKYTSRTEIETQSSAPVSKNTVVMKNFAFSPDVLTVKVGDTVNWVNEDLTGHSATADDITFDTGVFDSKGTKSVTFDKAGTFAYHCTAHPNMKGKIVVGP